MNPLAIEIWLYVLAAYLLGNNAIQGSEKKIKLLLFIIMANFAGDFS
jgi:hypothetical protein